jgi:hypothetical protein
MDLDKLIHSIFSPLLRGKLEWKKYVLALDYIQSLPHYLETRSPHKVQGIRIAMFSCFVQSVTLSL